MTTGRTHRSIFISAECSSFFNSGFSHVVKETCGVGANSDLRQEVQLVNESMEETVEESVSFRFRARFKSCREPTR